MERRMDELGRIVVPMEIRKSLGWANGTRLKIDVNGDTVTLKKNESCCVFCGSVDELKDVKCVRVCQSCIDEIKTTIFWEEA